MSTNTLNKTVDISGVELMPVMCDLCLGNGKQGHECCCDECDYFLLCFPEYDEKKQKKLKIKTVFSHNHRLSGWFSLYKNKTVYLKIGIPFLVLVTHNALIVRKMILIS